MADFDTRQYKLARVRQFDGAPLTRTQYNLVIGGMLVFGALINVAEATLLRGSILQIPALAVLLIYLVGSFGGMALVYRNRSVGAGIAGFTVLAASMGLLLTYFVSFYDTGSIALAFICTACTTGIMMALAALAPQVFLRMGRVLGISLLVSIFASLIVAFLAPALWTAFDWLMVLLFCGYIGFDWARAQRYPSNAVNAVQCAADIYVDIVNLFIRILDIIGISRN